MARTSDGNWRMTINLLSLAIVISSALSSEPDNSQCSSVGTSLASRSCTPGEAEENRIRLPRTLKPHHYDVELLPIVEQGNFTIIGKVSIDVECMQKSHDITLHSADIKIDEASITVRYT